MHGFVLIVEKPPNCSCFMTTVPGSMHNYYRCISGRITPHDRASHDYWIVREVKEQLGFVYSPGWSRDAVL